MENNLLTIDPQQEKMRIVSFLKETFAKQNIQKAIIGISGGIDSAVSFSLLKEVLKPNDIIIAHLYYFESKFTDMEKVIKKAKIPENNIYHLSIKNPVDAMIK